MFTFDTVLEVKLYGANKKEAKRIENVVKRIADRLDSTFDLFDSTSELSCVNSNEKSTISSEFRFALEKSIEWYNKTNGAFDPTVGALTLLWDFNSTNPFIPDDSLIIKALETLGVERLVVSGNELKKPVETKLDFGGIAKGYLVDVLYDTIKSLTKSPFLINAGGNIRVCGRDAVIGIRDPRKTDSVIGKFLLKDGYACATSGDYERYFIIGGKRYHHIIDPHTGKPREGICAVTVIARNGIDADCASTAIFVLGVEKGLKFADEENGLDCIIFVEKYGELRYYISNGMERKYKLKLAREVKR